MNHTTRSRRTTAAVRKTAGPFTPPAPAATSFGPSGPPVAANHHLLEMDCSSPMCTCNDCACLEKRLSARSIYTFLDESKSKFWSRQDPDHESYDPLFPKPLASSSTGKGHKRWKRGPFMTWLRICEAVSNGS